jgi:hypothetical protein
MVPISTPRMVVVSLIAISCLVVVTHGHYPSVVSAVQEQAVKLKEIIFADIGRYPLLKLFPTDLDHFFSDSDSASVEGA